MEASVMASDVARILDGKVIGEDVPLKKISLIEDSTPDSLPVLYESEIKADLTSVPFGAVVIPPRFMLPHDRTFIISAKKIWHSLYEIVELFIEKGIYKKSLPHIVNGLSPAKQGKDCHIADTARFGENTVLGDRCIIGSHAVIGDNVVMGDDVIVECGAVVGNEGFQFCYDNKILNKVPAVGSVVIGNNVEIGANSTVELGTIGDTVIGSGTKIGDMVHIGHEVKIGRNCMIVAQTALAGWSEIGNNVTIYGQTGISNSVKVNDNAVILAKSGVIKNVRENETVWGMPAENVKDFMRQHAFLRRQCNERRRK